MAENNAPENTGGEGAPAGSSQYTDEQLQAAFPGQDIEHVRSMMDKRAGTGKADPNADGDDNGNADDNAVEYPEWIPEKFRQGSVEDAMQKLAESYTGLERARSGAAADDAGTDSGDQQLDGEGEGEESTLSLVAIENEYVQTGAISEETYADAEAHGMPREVLDAYIEGQKSIATKLVSSVHEMAGGEESYTNMTKWAETNWSEAEVDQFDKVIASGNQGQIALAVKALKADFVAANGQDASVRLDGDSDKSGNVQGFASKAEMTEAIRDPRYKKDPAYRAQVAQKIHAGNVWGMR